MAKDVNIATTHDLEQVPQVSAACAEAIVRWRDTYGPFKDIIELAEVPGVDHTAAMQLAAFFTAGANNRRGRDTATPAEEAEDARQNRTDQ